MNIKAAAMANYYAMPSNDGTVGAGLKMGTEYHSRRRQDFAGLRIMRRRWPSHADTISPRYHLLSRCAIEQAYLYFQAFDDATSLPDALHSA